MNEISSNRCVFMGLPLSGKSTFIGAFWHVVESKEIDSMYEISTPPENREYLNKLRTAWLDCKAPDRTNSSLFKEIVLQIKEKSSGKVLDFIFPDVSGEMYESQFEHRKLTNDYLNKVKSSDALMLFINPDFVRQPHLISDADEMLDDELFAGIIDPPPHLPGDREHIGPEQLAHGRTITDPVLRKEKKWISKESQTQVILVDLLQMVKEKVKTPCRVLIVISAWDLIMSISEDIPKSSEPMEWFAKHLPLLKQFLTSNSEIITYDVFGVSAQGASYKKDVESLYSFTQPSQRIKVQQGSVISNDITLPIKWLLNG